MDVQQSAPLAEATAALLEELSLSSDLQAKLEIQLLRQDRPAFLSHLKNDIGITLLKDRQRLANGISKAMREAGAVAYTDPGAPATAPIPAAAPAAAAGPSAAAEPDALRLGAVVPVRLLPGQSVRVFVISDVHTDNPLNLKWLKAQLPRRLPAADGAPATFDVCLCPGDVSDKPAVLRETLATLRGRFDEVVFTPGNHDLWLTAAERARDGFSSLDKAVAIMRLCAEERIRTAPLRIISDGAEPDLLIVPLLSWYHAGWDLEPELPTDDVEQFAKMWADFHRLDWPAGHLSAGFGIGGSDGCRALADYFDACNWNGSLHEVVSSLPPAPASGRPPPASRLDKLATYALFGETPFSTAPIWSTSDLSKGDFFRRRPDAASDVRGDAAAVPVPVGGAAAAPPSPRRPFVLSLSHFAPRQELLPEKRLLLAGEIHKVSGSAPLERTVRRLMPDVHVFGHTHMPMDRTVDGVRYIQWALGTPREQRSQTRVVLGFMCVFDSAAGGEAPTHWTHWGEHYEKYERDLTKTAPAPWVLKFKQVSRGEA